jgi:hypothetical protein
MKYAYISFVFVDTGSTTNYEIQKLDCMLHEVTARHEILIVMANQSSSIDESLLELYGPVSLIKVNTRSSEDEMMLSALGRAVGDFVVSWQTSIGIATQMLLKSCLDKTNQGHEIVEIASRSQSKVTRIAYFATNFLRKSDRRIQRSKCVLYSRFAIEKLLSYATYDPQLRIILAELPVSRATVYTEEKIFSNLSLSRRIIDMISLIAKGSRLGRAIPMVFTGLSAFLGIGIMLYSLVSLLVKDSTPEGWTTLMMISGLNFAVLMSNLTLIWSRLDSISKSVATKVDQTSSVSVVGPSKS